MFRGLFSEIQTEYTSLWTTNLCTKWNFNFSVPSLPFFLEQLETIVSDICNDGAFNAEPFKYYH